MAASRGLCIKWTFKRILSNTYLPFTRIRTPALNTNTCGIILSTQRRFYCSNERSDDGETKDESSSEPRNLLEVYQTEPTLLHGPRKPLKPVTDDYVEQELEKSRQIRDRTPAPINPHEAQWSPDSKRCGMIGVKLGMSALWLKDGKRKPVTMVEVILNGYNRI